MTSNRAAPLFQPFDIRSLSMRNRTVMAPMGRMFSRENIPSPDAAAYYRRRAEGEVGLIIAEATGIDHPLSTDHPGVPVMHGDAALASWKSVVDEVHRAGGRIIPQLFHQGMLRGGSIGDATLENLRPSGGIGQYGPNSYKPGFIEAAAKPTRPMSEEEIADVIAAFARSAANAVALGFDGIAIHGAHGYVIDSFLWSASNQRADRFGGGPAARALFAAEVIKAVRAVVPDHLPLFFRFSHHKSHNYDARLTQTPEELEALLGPLVDGGVDVLDASIRRFWQPAFDGSPLNLAGWAKKLTGLPVIAVGSVGIGTTASETFMASSPDKQMDNIDLLIERFETGEFDMIGIGRSLIADPNYVSKLRTGEAVIPFSRTALETLI
jgi:2,4-dienoyl-CoA reductase-like NADH-dependent reductase (Old Yellow Enzyme family)